MAYDRHSVCSTCRGQECDDINRCEECTDWTKEVMEKYLKQKKALVAKSKSKSRKESDTEKPSDSSSGGAGVNHPGQGDRTGVEKGLSEERVFAMIRESMAGLTSEFSQSMQESYSNIVEMVDNKINSSRQDSSRQDVINPSVSAPSHPPVFNVLGQGHEDPSRSKPQTIYRKIGAQPVESEGEESTISPINDVLAMLSNAGVVVPESIVRTLSRSDSSANVSQPSLGLGSVSGFGHGLGAQAVGATGAQGATGSQVSSGAQGLVTGAQMGTDALGSAVDSQGAEANSRSTVGAGSWFDSSINQGAGTSRSVNFSNVSLGPSDHRFEGEVEDDGDSVLGEKVAASEGLRRVLHMLFSLCPDAAPKSAEKRSKCCQFEGMFAELSKQSKEDLNPVLFHRVDEIL